MVLLRGQHLRHVLSVTTARRTDLALGKEIRVARGVRVLVQLRPAAPLQRPPSTVDEDVAGGGTRSVQIRARHWLQISHILVARLVEKVIAVALVAGELLDNWQLDGSSPLVGLLDVRSISRGSTPL